MADTTYDSFGNVVDVGSDAAAQADPTGLAQQQLDLNSLFSGTTDSSNLGGILSGLKSLFSGTSPFGAAGQFLAAAGLGKLVNNLMGGSGQSGPAGYRGGIPEYVATRTQTPMAQQRPTTMGADGKPVPYRPGQGGITYFTPMQYEYKGGDLGAPKSVGAPITGGTSGGSNAGIDTGGSVATPGYAGKVVIDNEPIGAAVGGYMPSGIAMLAAGGGGRYLRGPGDGVSDSIPAKFEQSGQPARLADGEFVIDARTVSEIGNGSSEAGARKLYAMMDRVHKARRTAKRGEPSKADKYLPK